MNGELLSLLGTVRGNSIIGYCIQYALSSQRQDDILNTLKDMAGENPGMLIHILGERAFSLLTQCDGYDSISQVDNKIDSE